MTTLTYYSTHALAFAQDTAAVDFTTTQKRFLKYLAPGAYILDFGCGSGRDSKCFLAAGYKVLATDGCEELCELAAKLTGLKVQHMLFSELEAVEEFAGIWACASILHVPKAQLPDILERMWRALKQGGYAYISFKYGDFEGERNGRYFTDLTEKSLGELLKTEPSFTVVEEWTSADVRAGRSDERWLNVILKKD